jgi:copper transport protein
VRRARPVVGALLFLVVAVGLHPQPALGHALLVSSDPAANAILATAPRAISLTFTEPPDPKLSSVEVLDASGTSHASGPAIPSAAGSTTLQVPVGPLPEGVYTVAWRTVSAADGHSAAGSFAFSVGTAAPAASGLAGGETLASPGSSTVSPASVLARWLFYLGLVGLVGAAAAAALGRRRGRWLLRLAGGAWLVATIGAVLLVVSQASDAGVGVGDLAGTTLGWDAVGRIVPLLVAGLLLLGARRGGARQAHLLRLVAVVAALEMLSDAAVSHAAAAPLALVNIAVQWLHFLAVGTWIGGLAGILLELRGAPSPEKGEVVRSFSRWATIGLAVVALTGVLRAAVELGSIDALVSTDYGRLILVKVALLGGLLGLGAVNHFRNVPRAARTLSGLRRVGSAEILVATAVILVASVLVNVPPPVDMAAAVSAGPSPSPSAPPVLAVEGHDYATSVKLDLAVSPGTAGPNTFHATVVDYDTGQPVAASSLVLRFAYPARPDVGTSTLTLAPAGGGMFVGSGSNLSLGGAWSVTALVTTAAPVEVPLVVTIPFPPSQVDVNRAAGQPTLYTVHLSTGRTAQVYLDPSGAGRADLHITYFDASGGELPVTKVTVTVATPGSAPEPVTLNQLEPGHVVGKVPATAGTPITLAVRGSAPAGDQLDFHLDITPDS